MTGQSEFARRSRLKNGCCPIHGHGMSQVQGYGYTKDGRFDDRSAYTVVGCPRRGCTVLATTTGPDRQAFLLPDGFVVPSAA
jgi:hypothetical protein